MVRVLFGAVAGFDLGASNPRQGNLRIRLFSDEGKPIADSYGSSYKGPVSKAGFKDGASLVYSIGDRIQALVQQVKNNGNWPKEERLKQVIGLIPGPVVNNTVPIMANLHDKAGQSLKNMAFAVLKDRLTDKPDIKVFNDMAGGSAFALQHLLKGSGDNALKPGDKASFHMIGGGYGLSQIHHQGTEAHVHLGEGGHLHARQPEGSLESTWASVPKFLQHFSAKLPLSEAEQAAFVSKGDARPVFDDDTFFKQYPQMDRAQFQQAKHHVIGQLLDTVLTGMGSKVLEGHNATIVAGPLMTALTRYLDLNPDRYIQDINVAQQVFNLSKPGGQALPIHQQVILGRLYRQLDDAGKAQLTKAPFKIESDLNLSDNLSGIPLLMKAQQVGNRSDWLKIPLQ